MKVNVVNSSQVYPAESDGTTFEKTLPAIDAWYAFVRTQAMVCMFESPSTLAHPAIAPRLIDSLSHSLKAFPFFAGRLDTSSTTVHGRDGQPRTVRRPKILWGGDDDVGVTFIEAHTTTRLDHLLPPVKTNSPGYLWDRSASRFEALFPREPTSKAVVRVQFTIFGCGGFAIGVDTDHAFADGYVCGMLMQHWSALFNKQPTSSLIPPMYLGSELDSDILGSYQSRPVSAVADRPLVRTPCRRDLVREDANLNGVLLNGDNDSNRTIPCMLHLSSKRYERIAEAVQARTSTRITDHVAVAAFLWAALNRARQRTHRQAIDCHMTLSLRGPLDLPPGLIGSPFLGIMLACGNETESTDATRLAVQMNAAIEKFDEHAMRDTVYEAMLQDSPSSSARTPFRAERMTFTSAAQSGWDRLAFGTPMFVTPLLPWSNLFVMVENIRASGDRNASEDSETWHRNGVNIFFHVNEDVYEALTWDHAFTDIEKIQEM